MDEEGRLTLDDADTVLLSNVSNSWPSNEESHPRRPESSLL